MTKNIFKIYKILNESIDKNEKDPYQLINILVQRVNRDIREKGSNTKFDKPKESNVDKKNFGGDNLEVVLYKANHSIESMFNDFFVSDLLGGTKFNKSEDIFICFVIIKDNIYFFSSSHTFAYFLSYVDEDFSLTIASKIITGKIKYEKSVSIMGETLTSDLIFRGLKGFSKFDNLGKVIKGFIGEIDNTKSNKLLNLTIPSNKSYFCEIGNSFTLRVGLDYKDTINLINDLNILYLEGNKDDDYKDFQMLEKINTRFEINKGMKIKLNEKVLEIIFEYYTNKLENVLDSFELVHSTKFLDFIECHFFIISFDGKEKKIEGILHLKDIIDFIKEMRGDNLSKEVLLGILQDEISLIGYNPDGKLIIDSSKKDLFQYIITEFSCEEEIEIITEEKVGKRIIKKTEKKNVIKKYFLINGDYYYVKEQFLEILDKDLIEELSNDEIYLNASVEKKLLPWKTGSEGDYNKSYLVQNNFIVLDKVLYKGIEFCDLLYFENNDSYLFHNKKGFEGDMRILSEQVLISSITLSENRKLGNTTIFEEYYNSLQRKQGQNPNGTLKSMHDIGLQSDSINKKEFINHFDNTKELKFVLAFTYNDDLISIFKSGKKRDFAKLSVIAKYELLTLIKKMRSIGLSLYITQIKTK